MTHLLAKKTPSDGDRKTLVDHTQDVVDAAEALFGTAQLPTRLGRAWLRFFRLDPNTDVATFHANLLAACLFHDWGKANADMQARLTGSAGGQLFRHEHISALLLGYEGIKQWLRPCVGVDWEIVLAAVGSHHLKFDDASFASDDGTGATVQVLFDHDEFRNELVPLTARRLGLEGCPSLPSQRHWGFSGDASTFDPSHLRDELRNGLLHRMQGLSDTRMLLAVRAALILADAAGSGLPRTGRRFDWIQDQFSENAACDVAAIERVIAQRVEDLVRQGRWSRWSEFQEQCQALPSRALLLAPCGAGKTLAAWRWIVGQVKRQAVNRVLFLYPTRATATEGFKDYISWAPEATAGLVHGTAEYDLDGMFDAEDVRAGKQFADSDPRLFALKHWSKQIFSATVDQFLGFMANGYGPMCLLPLLADSVVVVDEVHSFDRAMFSALLGFLKAFDVPVLCMTATLQQGRRKQLEALVGTIYGPEQYPADLVDTAGQDRYRIKRITEADALRSVLDAARTGKRVLWVVNQVSRAQETVLRLSTLLPQGIPLLCYHSRFTLDDRVARHRETVDAIRAGRPAAVAVTTQVCEMSLDIDADLLVTEECPVSSLIQRMGRCRRGRSELAAKGPGDVLVYPPAEEKVYSRQNLAGVDGFLSCLSNKSAVSQTDLEMGLEEFGGETAEAPKLSSFLSSGPYALGGEDSFRESEDFNVQAVLASQINDYVAATKAMKPGFVLPVPKKVRPERDSRLPPYLFAADDRHYGEKTGFWDTPIR